MAGGAHESRVWRAFSLRWLLLAASLAPLLLPFVVLLNRSRTYTPSGDVALIERSVRAVGTKAVLLGPYSRFGWHHPGPTMYYLLAAPYRLLGGASVALPLATLLLNIACIAGIAVVLQRRAGTVAMVWGIVVLAAYLRSQEAGFLINDWNPYLPLLPFCLGVLLCWSLLVGDRWALPVCLAIGTLCVQSHLGYGIGVAAVGIVTGAGLALRLAVRRRLPRGQRCEREQHCEQLPSWRWPAIAALLIVVLLWLPVVVQQVTGHPGNVTLLARYFGSTQPSWTYAQGVRELSTSLGRLPALAADVQPRQEFLTPVELPWWTGATAAAVTAGASVLIALRHRVALPLVALVWVLASAVVIAVHHVVGPLFSYLVPYTWGTGVLAWMLVGVAISLEVRGLAWPASHLWGRPWLALPVAVALLLAFVPIAVRASGPVPFNTPELRPLAQAVLRWDARRPGDLLEIGAAPSTGLVGATALLSGLFVRLDRAGAPVRVAKSWETSFGPDATAGVERARWLVQVAYTDGTSAPPAPGQRVLARFGSVQAYVSPLPVRSPSGP